MSDAGVTDGVRLGLAYGADIAYVFQERTNTGVY
jgi:hypothetical protein